MTNHTDSLRIFFLKSKNVVRSFKTLEFALLPLEFTDVWHLKRECKCFSLITGLKQPSSLKYELWMLLAWNINYDGMWTRRYIPRYIYLRTYRSISNERAIGCSLAHTNYRKHACLVALQPIISLLDDYRSIDQAYVFGAIYRLWGCTSANRVDENLSISLGFDDKNSRKSYILLFYFFKSKPSVIEP